MKKLLAILALLAVIASLFFLLRKSPSSENPIGQNGMASIGGSNSSLAGSNTQIIPPALAKTSALAIASTTSDLASRAASPNPPIDATAETNTAAALPPLTVLDKARVVIHNYRAAFGENPVGTNPEIASALQGKNPKQINFLAESGLQLNGKGEIIDGYGTPFFFHQISGQEMEIRSAGPDRVMWTQDDGISR